MKNKPSAEHGGFHLPIIGQRIAKTTVAVFLCLLFYYLRGYRGQDMPTEAAITAIICMQPYVRDTRDYALNRFAGTLVGAFWGLLFLLLLFLLPALGRSMIILYALMALGVLLSLYSSVLIRKPDVSSLAAIVFICIVISFPEIDQPLRQAANRILGVLLGTAVAIAVNVFRLPRRKNRGCVFFVRTKDLAPDRFSAIPSAALYRLNYLYQDGAKICLISEHAPAFFSLQMSEAMLNMPLIVMDGAAIYDADENSYLWSQTIGGRSALRLKELLDRLHISYFIYVIHNDKTCVFHQGALSDKEALIYNHMRRSPYRSYLDGENYEPDEIVYFKMIADKAQITAIRRRLQSFLRSRKLRSAVREEAGAEGVSALYIYSGKATVERAESELMALLRRDDPSLRPVEIFLRSPYRSEHDAMSLLHTLGNYYEPLCLFPRRKK